MITRSEPPARSVDPGAPFGIIESPEPAIAALAVAATEWQMRRVAREVHDTVGGALTAARIVVDRVKRDGSMRDEASRDATDEALAILDLAIRDVRAFLRDVDLPPLDDGGLVAVLRRLLSSYAAMGAFAGRVRRHPLEPRLPYEVEVTAYRITQEALTNVARHADASFVEIDVRQRRQSIELTITDDGRGFDAIEACERARTGESLGLRGMLERAQMLGGTLEIRSERDLGSTIRAELPLRSTAASLTLVPFEPAG